ncbi:MAG: nucleotide exchange factor GrpE [Kiritimatiellia bacterium]|jgi:molecular chaperone GrpE|nr:nucleotide exchange factor GrpE [Kiritimatiellia bacterium]
MTKKHSHSKQNSPAPEENGHVPPADDVAAEAADEATVETAAEATPPPPEPLPHQMLRLQADFENYRKRMAREKLDWIAFASEKLVMDLLPVLDHFELGLADCANNGAPKTFTEGFHLIYTQLLSAIEKAGVQAIDAEGQPFDPNLHEAMSAQHSDTVPVDHVMTQTRRGYKMGEKLLRPAQVIVSSGPAAD